MKRRVVSWLAMRGTKWAGEQTNNLANRSKVDSATARGGGASALQIATMALADVVVSDTAASGL